MALVKLIFIAGSLFGMGTLPWQQNFIGLFAGISFGTLLTVALVPFVSITKYGRQKKVISFSDRLCKCSNSCTSFPHRSI